MTDGRMVSFVRKEDGRTTSGTVTVDEMIADLDAIYRERHPGDMVLIRAALPGLFEDLSAPMRFWSDEGWCVDVRAA